MTNLSVNHQDSRIVLNRGLTVSEDKQNNGLALRGSNDTSLLGSIDSKQMVKNLSSSQRYIGSHDFFITLTCNMKKHFGTAPVKAWVDSDDWLQHYPDVHTLTDAEKAEIKTSINQAAGGLFLHI